MKPILSKFHSYFGKQPVHILKAEDQLKIYVSPPPSMVKMTGEGKKMTEKIYSLITQIRFWQFLVVLSGFLGFPRTMSFGGLSLYFDNFFGRKKVGC